MIISIILLNLYKLQRTNNKTIEKLKHTKTYLLTQNHKRNKRSMKLISYIGKNIFFRRGKKIVFSISEKFRSFLSY